MMTGQGRASLGRGPERDPVLLFGFVQDSPDLHGLDPQVAVVFIVSVEEHRYDQSLVWPNRSPVGVDQKSVWRWVPAALPTSVGGGFEKLCDPLSVLIGGGSAPRGYVLLDHGPES